MLANCMNSGIFRFMAIFFNQASTFAQMEILIPMGLFVCVCVCGSPPCRLPLPPALPLHCHYSDRNRFIPLTVPGAKRSQKADAKFFVRDFYRWHSVRFVCTDIKLMVRRNSVHSRFDPETANYTFNFYQNMMAVVISTQRHTPRYVRRALECRSVCAVFNMKMVNGILCSNSTF